MKGGFHRSGDDFALRLEKVMYNLGPVCANRVLHAGSLFKRICEKDNILENIYNFNKTSVNFQV
jgi:hypothetical protein